MRTITHIIDTRAVKKVVSTLPDHWAVRELTERDYGIDLMVEVFLPGSKDKKQRDAYEASGALFHIQIKGTQKAILPDNATVGYRLKKRTLRYVERFNVPFFLFRTDVSSPSGKIYFVWLQRYIRDVLDTNNPFWREEAGTSVLLNIPERNEIGLDNDCAKTRMLERIQRVALRPKYLEELVEYREIFRDFKDRLSAMSYGQHEVNDAALEELRVLLYRIRRLSVLLAQNISCIDRACVDEAIQYVHQLDARTITSEAWQELPHGTNFMLLFHSLEGIACVENLVAENDGETVY